MPSASLAQQDAALSRKPERYIPDAELAIRHLDSICASVEFARSERMISFLRFVVQAALQGQERELTERLIGREVFKKAERLGSHHRHHCTIRGKAASLQVAKLLSRVWGQRMLCGFASQPVGTRLSSSWFASRNCLRRQPLLPPQPLP